MTPVFSKDLNLTINHLKLFVFFLSGPFAHSGLPKYGVLKWDKRDQKK